MIFFVMTFAGLMIEMNKPHLLAILLLATLFFTLVSSTIITLSVLQGLGISSVFAEIKLGSYEKFYVSLQLTLTALSACMLAFGIHFWRKRLMKGVGILAASSEAPQVASIVCALAFGFSLPATGLLLWAFGVALSATAAIMGLTMSAAEFRRAPIMLPHEIAVSSVLSALTAVIMIITGALVPSPTGGYTHIGDMIIFVAALLFGSKVGGVTGIIGSVVADFWLAYPRWYVSIPAHGLEGIIAGFGKNRRLTIQVLLCACAGFVMASTYFYVNVFIKGYPLAVISYARDLFGQAGVSMILALIVARSAQRVKPLWR